MSTLLPATSAAIVALAFLLPWLLDIRRADFMILVAVQVAIASAGLVQGFLNGCRPVQIVTFGFLLSYLGVAPAYQLSHNKAAWSDSTVLYGDPSRTQTALLLTVSATAALLIGFFVASRVGLRTGHGVSLRTGRPRPFVPWLLIGGALAMTPRAVAAAGGWGGMFGTRVGRADAVAGAGIALATNGGFAVALVSILPGVLALVATLVFLTRSVPVVRKAGVMSLNLADATGLVVGVPLTLLHVNPFTSSRFLVVMALGAITIFLLNPRSRRAGLVFAFLVLAGTLLVYPLLNVFRRSNDNSDVVSGWSTLASPDFDGFQQVINTIQLVQHSGHTGGNVVLSGIFFFVPRSLWHGKSTPSGVLVAEDRGYIFTNLSEPLHAELYLDFGPVLAVLLVLTLGFFLGRLDRLWLSQPRSRAAILTPLIAMAMLAVIRGPIGAAAPIYLSAVLVLFACIADRRPDEEVDDVHRSTRQPAYAGERGQVPRAQA